MSQTTESRHPVWNFYSQFPLVDEVDSLQLAVKVSLPVATVDESVDG